jgi:hypothetical protein
LYQENISTGDQIPVVISAIPAPRGKLPGVALPAQFIPAERKKPLLLGLMGEVTSEAGKGPSVHGKVGGQDGHGARRRDPSVMEMGIPVASDAETVPCANEQLRRGPGVGIMAGGASPVPHRPVDAPPQGIRFVARNALPGVLPELGKRGVVRGMAGRALASGNGLMKVPFLSLRGFFEIAVAGVACLFLVLHLQLPVRQEMASVASVVQGRVEGIGPEYLRRGPLSFGGGETARRGAGEIIHPHGFRACLDAVEPGRQADFPPLERFPFEPSHRLPVDENGKGTFLSLSQREHPDRRLGGQGQVGGEKENRRVRGAGRITHPRQQEKDQDPSYAHEGIDPESGQFGLHHDVAIFRPGSHGRPMPGIA